MALVVIFIVPIVGIVLFWIVHVLPEKIAHKRHHPQTRRDPDAVPAVARVRRPAVAARVAVGLHEARAHKLAYGTDKHDDYYAERRGRGPPPIRAPICRADVADLRGNVERMLANGGTPAELTAIRDQLAALEPRIAARSAAGRSRGEGAPLMEILLLGIYASSSG